MTTRKKRNRKRRTRTTLVTLDVKQLMRSLFSVRRLVPSILVLVVLASIPVVGYGLYQYLHRSPYFNVKTVLVESGEVLSNSEILALLELDREPNILKLDTVELRKRLEKNPWIREARIEKQLPDTLMVQVTEEAPAAYLLMKSLFLINAYGELFKLAEEGESFDMPVISGFTKADFMEKASKEEAQRRIREALAIDKLYSSLGLQQSHPLAEIQYDQILGFTIVARSVSTRIRLGFSDYREKLTKLQAVLTDLGPRAADVDTIFLDNERAPERVTVRFMRTASDGEGNTDG